MKVDISRDSLICILSRNGLYYPCCSSQEEHVLKLNSNPNAPAANLLLLARGACIETVFGNDRQHLALLLLARGACIETLNCSLFMTTMTSCSSQEEHVLKPFAWAESGELNELLLARGACIETGVETREFSAEISCSSQEEHVLKLLPAYFSTECASSCSSQEEHVLKPCSGFLQLERGKVAPRKRSMYWNIILLW